MATPCSTSPRPASLARRLGAIVYDAVILLALLFVASALIVIPLGLTPAHPAYPFYVVYLYLVALAFFAGFWTHGGQTLGMKTWGIRVEQDNGTPIAWTQACLRFAAALLSWLPLGAGFLWCLLNPERRALHDILSGTRLVRSP